MSAKERPEVAAFRELETLVKRLGEELAVARRQALRVEGPKEPASKAKSERVAALEADNSTLKTRIGRAEDRVKQMIERVRFLRQQLQIEVVAGGAR